MLGSFLVDIGAGLRVHVSKRSFRKVKSRVISYRILVLVKLVTDGILGSSGTGVEGSIAILGNLLVGLLGCT